jgi:hypothetical protein
VAVPAIEEHRRLPADDQQQTNPIPSIRRGVAIVSSALSGTAPEPATPNRPVGGPRALDRFKSPTYPQRVHLHERGELEASLGSCEERLQAVQNKLSALGNHPQRASFERLYQQMLGARDQVAEAVRRLPLETGALYDEDRERFEQAIAAFERAHRRWDTL